MQHKKTITIQGIVYDFESGQPIGKSPAAAPVHAIRKFAGDIVSANHNGSPDIAPTVHPLAAKVNAKQKYQVQPRSVKPSHVLKAEALNEALSDASHHSRAPLKLKKPISRKMRRVRLAGASIMVLLAGAYLMFLSMPSITTSIAATQAGIRASYPSYVPTGYNLAGPIMYENGAVSMRFNAAAAPLGYTIDQQRSNWDSSAVRENYVMPAAGEKYSTTELNGLTIYAFGQNAAWVNGGILYKITGNAPLSGDQIQRIAISL